MTVSRSRRARVRGRPALASTELPVAAAPVELLGASGGERGGKFFEEPV